ncbi:MAG: DUF5009 domain-containing protein [Candidatus Bathyarchaeota archaeon]|nr:MAG: DUF5009 domain-containing protein [Candidatus Bathyarchaeota archaeon]
MTLSTDRHIALDAFRGFIMLLLVSNGLGFFWLLDHPTYGGVAACFEHVAWDGLMFWDLVQPAFLFIVGVAMPFALSKRREEGATQREMFLRVVRRSVVLIVLSQILIIIAEQRIYFQLINVLSQIALTYFLTYLLLPLKFRWQVVSGAAILVGHSVLFMGYPSGFSPTDNIGAVLDRAVLGYNYVGGYVTINFLTSTVTTLAGAWTGMLLKSQRSLRRKGAMLVAWAAGSLGAGIGLSVVVPIVKRLWTASFTLYSLGWVLLMMVGFLLVVEVCRLQKLVFPLVVVGMNPLFYYCMGFLLRDAITSWLHPFTGGFSFAGDLAPVAQALAVIVVMWMVAYWLYRHKIFFKV